MKKNGLLLWCQYRSVKSRHILVIVITLLVYYLSVVWKGGLPWGVDFFDFFFNPLCVLILWFDREMFDCIQLWRHASDRFRWVLRAHAGRRMLLFDLFARRFLCVWSSVLCTTKSSQSGKKEACEIDVFFYSLAGHARTIMGIMT